MTDKVTDLKDWIDEEKGLSSENLSIVNLGETEEEMTIFMVKDKKQAWVQKDHSP